MDHQHSSEPVKAGNLTATLVLNGDSKRPRVRLALDDGAGRPIIEIETASLVDGLQAQRILRRVVELAVDLPTVGSEPPIELKRTALLDPNQLRDLLDAARSEGITVSSSAAIDCRGIVAHYRDELASRTIPLADPKIQYLDIPFARSADSLKVDFTGKELNGSDKIPKLEDRKMRWLDISLPLYRAPETSEQELLPWLRANFGDLVERTGIHPEKMTFMEARSFKTDANDHCKIAREHLCLWIGKDLVVTFHSSEQSLIEQMGRDPRYTGIGQDGQCSPGLVACDVLIRAFEHNVRVLRGLRDRAIQVSDQVNIDGSIGQDIMTSVVPTLQTALTYSGKKIHETDEVGQTLLNLNKPSSTRKVFGDMNPAEAEELVDRVIQTITRMATTREMAEKVLTDAINRNFAVNNIQIAADQRRLALAATVVLPVLTLCAVAQACQVVPSPWAWGAAGVATVALIKGLRVKVNDVTNFFKPRNK